MENPNWISITPPMCRDFVAFSVKLDEEGTLKGKLKASFHNYSAFIERHVLKEDPNASFWKGRLGNEEEVMYYQARVEDYTWLFWGSLIINFVFPMLLLMCW